MHAYFQIDRNMETVASHTKPHNAHPEVNSCELSVLIALCK